MTYTLLNADCFDWLATAQPNSVHAVVTDSPYGLIEFSDRARGILQNGQRGGVWRIPPSFDGSKRDPLPRFTVLGDREKAKLREYMKDWATLPYHLSALRYAMDRNRAEGESAAMSTVRRLAAEVERGLLEALPGLRKTVREKPKVVSR